MKWTFESLPDESGIYSKALFQPHLINPTKTRTSLSQRRSHSSRRVRRSWNNTLTIKYGHVCCYLGNLNPAHNSRKGTLYHRDVIEMALDGMDGWMVAATISSRLKSISTISRLGSALFRSILVHSLLSLGACSQSETDRYDGPT